MRRRSNQADHGSAQTSVFNVPGRFAAHQHRLTFRNQNSHSQQTFLPSCPCSWPFSPNLCVWPYYGTSNRLSPASWAPVFHHIHRTAIWRARIVARIHEHSFVSPEICSRVATNPSSSVRQAFVVGVDDEIAVQLNLLCIHFQQTKRLFTQTQPRGCCVVPGRVARQLRSPGRDLRRHASPLSPHTTSLGCHRQTVHIDFHGPLPPPVRVVRQRRLLLSRFSFVGWQPGLFVPLFRRVLFYLGDRLCHRVSEPSEQRSHGHQAHNHNRYTHFNSCPDRQ